MDGIGLVCAAVAVVCFGSNFVVLKGRESGDGEAPTAALPRGGGP
jgi:hypothetical protein